MNGKRIFSIYNHICESKEEPHFPILITENIDEIIGFLKLDFTHQYYCFYDSGIGKNNHCLVVRNVESQLLLKILPEYKRKSVLKSNWLIKTFTMSMSNN